MGKKVLGLDLAKTALPDAIAAMVEAWYEAQDVDGEPRAAKQCKISTDPWWDKICTYCPELPKEFTTGEALVAFGLINSIKLVSRADEMRIAPMLRQLGYVKSKSAQKLANGMRRYLWQWSQLIA